MARKKAAEKGIPMKLVPVRFVKHWRGYNEDEVAGFRPDVAEKLVEAKMAKKVSPQDVAAHNKKHEDAAKEAAAKVTKPAEAKTTK